MTISLLSLQSRSATNAEAATQLGIAANRISTIARIHHRLHSYDGVQAVEFRKFLEDFARDFSAMLSSDERPERDPRRRHRSQSVGRGRDPARLHRQRVDHQRGEIRQRPNRHTPAIRSCPWLCAFSFQQWSGVAGRIQARRQQGARDEDHSIVRTADRRRVADRPRRQRPGCAIYRAVSGIATDGVESGKPVADRILQQPGRPAEGRV